MQTTSRFEYLWNQNAAQTSVFNRLFFIRPHKQSLFRFPISCVVYPIPMSKSVCLCRIPCLDIDVMRYWTGEVFMERTGRKRGVTKVPELGGKRFLELSLRRLAPQCPCGFQHLDVWYTVLEQLKMRLSEMAWYTHVRINCYSLP